MDFVDARMLTCPGCGDSLDVRDEGMSCGSCGSLYRIGASGYVDFLGEDDLSEKVSTNEKKAENQSSAGANRIDDEYIKPLLYREPFDSVLDVGCGIGRLITKLAQEGKEAYGIDLSCLAGFWTEAANDPRRFFFSKATSLPFADGYFDVVFSMGVIEHIGTGTGHCTLQEDYREQRQRYADEILRVTRPGGRIIISCPNKLFPFDHQHEVTDRFSCDSATSRLRSVIFRRTGFNIHKTWGDYHLLSYREVEDLFCAKGGAGSFEALSLDGYFGFSRLKRGRLKPLAGLAEGYFKKMPPSLRRSFINPYMMAQIRK